MNAVYHLKDYTGDSYILKKQVKNKGSISVFKWHNYINLKLKIKIVSF